MDTYPEYEAEYEFQILLLMNWLKNAMAHPRPRPTQPASGDLYYNADTKRIEVYTGREWIAFRV